MKVVNGKFNFDDDEWVLGDVSDLLDEKKLRTFLNESFTALIDPKSNDGFSFYVSDESFTGEDFTVSLHFGSGESDPRVEVVMSELLGFYLDDHYTDEIEYYNRMSRTFRHLADKIDEAGRKSVAHYAEMRREKRKRRTDDRS
jgi:hypothetical protein